MAHLGKSVPQMRGMNSPTYTALPGPYRRRVCGFASTFGVFHSIPTRLRTSGVPCCSRIRRGRCRRQAPRPTETTLRFSPTAADTPTCGSCPVDVETFDKLHSRTIPPSPWVYRCGRQTEVPSRLSRRRGKPATSSAPGSSIPTVEIFGTSPSTVWASPGHPMAGGSTTPKHLPVSSTKSVRPVDHR